jgi:uroporphyrinogen-III synthase
MPHRSATAIAAISPAAAESVGGGWECIATASEPSDDALLALATRLCNNSPPK